MKTAERIQTIAITATCCACLFMALLGDLTTINHDRSERYCELRDQLRATNAGLSEMAVAPSVAFTVRPANMVGTLSVAGGATIKIAGRATFTSKMVQCLQDRNGNTVARTITDLTPGATFGVDAAAAAPMIGWTIRIKFTDAAGIIEHEFVYKVVA